MKTIGEKAGDAASAKIKKITPLVEKVVAPQPKAVGLKKLGKGSNTSKVVRINESDSFDDWEEEADIESSSVSWKVTVAAMLTSLVLIGAVVFFSWGFIESVFDGLTIGANSTQSSKSDSAAASREQEKEKTLLDFFKWTPADEAAASINESPDSESNTDEIKVGTDLAPSRRDQGGAGSLKSNSTNLNGSFSNSTLAESMASGVIASTGSQSGDISIDAISSNISSSGVSAAGNSSLGTAVAGVTTGGKSAEAGLSDNSSNKATENTTSAVSSIGSVNSAGTSSIESSESIGIATSRFPSDQIKELLSSSLPASESLDEFNIYKNSNFTKLPESIGSSSTAEVGVAEAALNPTGTETPESSSISLPPDETIKSIEQVSIPDSAKLQELPSVETGSGSIGSSNSEGSAGFGKVPPVKEVESPPGVPPAIKE